MDFPPASPFSPVQFCLKHRLDVFSSSFILVYVHCEKIDFTRELEKEQKMFALLNVILKMKMKQDWNWKDEQLGGVRHKAVKSCVGSKTRVEWLNI